MTKEEKQTWNLDYLQPLFKKFEDIPAEFKYILIEKDYIGMFGKTFTNEKLSHMYDDTEEFIFSLDNAVASLSKTVKKNLYKNFCKLSKIEVDENCIWLNKIL